MTRDDEAKAIGWFAPLHRPMLRFSIGTPTDWSRKLGRFDSFARARLLRGRGKISYDQVLLRGVVVDSFPPSSPGHASVPVPSVTVS